MGPLCVIVACEVVAEMGMVWQIVAEVVAGMGMVWNFAAVRDQTLLAHLVVSNVVDYSRPQELRTPPFPPPPRLMASDHIHFRHHLGCWPYVGSVCGALMWDPYVGSLCEILMWGPYVGSSGGVLM